MEGDELDEFEPVHETDLAYEPSTAPGKPPKEPKTFSSVFDREADTPPFGSRILTVSDLAASLERITCLCLETLQNEEDVWSKNAW
jgi:hypothetical protein